MKKSIVLFAHPRFENSTTDAKLINAYSEDKNITFRDLYEEYPEFNVLYMHERNLLKKYDNFVFHFPLFWFGIPPLLKLWIEEVFDNEWLFHPENDNPLKGKKASIVVTTDKSIQNDRKNTPNFSINNFLVPLLKSIEVTGMKLNKIIEIDAESLLSQEEIQNYNQKIKSLFID